MRHVITGVQEGSVAEWHGLQVGDILLQMNGENIQDEIDYQAISAQPSVTLTIERNGKAFTVPLQKEDWEPIGLRFGDSMTLKPKACRNNCMFCFVDQLPPQMRPSLYVKDDDWRFSLMMGNYITLTNVDEPEFQRIINRHASPLYISVHATDPDVRRRMMHNRFAGDVMERLTRLKDAGIQFHCQIVCCPGINDGEVLNQTLNDLLSLSPAARSVAIVPVGLTKFREHLPKLTLFNAQTANDLLEQIKPFQERCLQNIGTRFAFASDEFYCLSGLEVPPSDWYEGYPQIENGVGLLRQFTEQMEEAAQDDEGSPVEPRTYLIATGVSATEHIKRMCQLYAPQYITVHVVTIYNHFFGESITVSGLLTGDDIITQLPDTLLAEADALFLSANMLRHERDMFLCNMTVTDFQKRIPVPVHFYEDGYEFYKALHNELGE